ncbi:MAG: VanZ family protein [Paludibacteraceae bacterium]|nr:VanZ family protein [Paludibacteraceae bacterium]
MNLKFFRLYGLTIVVSLFIMYTCMMSSDSIPKPSWIANLINAPQWLTDNFDKIVHFGYYLILAVAAGSDFYRQRTDYGTMKMYMWTLLYPALLGGLIEVMQEYLTVSRSGDFLDLLADMLGAVTGYFIGKWLVPRYVKREKAGLQ